MYLRKTLPLHLHLHLHLPLPLYFGSLLSQFLVVRVPYTTLLQNLYVYGDRYRYRYRDR
jgi:hypothetical protein